MMNKNEQSTPLISIIIVVYNAISTIKSAIDSVVNQPYNVELIVIDGGSYDGTLAIIQQYDKDISYFISEKDKGIYDAMNKGINVATGKWIYFLGADDQLMPDILPVVLPILVSSQSFLVYGSIVYDNQHVFKSTLNWKTLLHNTVHHQAAFYNSALFDDFKYNNTIKIMADYELNLIIWKKKILSEKIDTVVARCTRGGSSFNIDLSMKETNMIRGEHFPKTVNAIFSSILSLKYFIHYVLLRKV